MTTFGETKKLCEDFIAQHPNTATQTVYWLEPDLSQEVDHYTVARIGGFPIGMDTENLPMGADYYMHHVFTIDLKQLPLLAQNLNPDLRAIALFVDDPLENEAYTPYNRYSKVVFLTEAEVSKGVCELLDYMHYTESVAMKVHALVVPQVVFEETERTGEEYDGEEDEGQLVDIRDAIYNAPARVLGQPIWIQGAELEGDFIMQFDGNFTEINLGDMGVMYVFQDTAFWQCY